MLVDGEMMQQAGQDFVVVVGSNLAKLFTQKTWWVVTPAFLSELARALV